MIRILNGIVGGSDKYQRSHRRVNQRGPGIGGGMPEKTHGRGNFEGTEKSYPGLPSQEEQ